MSALATEKTGKILWFQTEDGQTQLDVRLANETVWLSVQQIAIYLVEMKKQSESI